MSRTIERILPINVVQSVTDQVMALPVESVVIVRDLARERIVEVLVHSRYGWARMFRHRAGVYSSSHEVKNMVDEWDRFGYAVEATS